MNDFEFIKIELKEKEIRHIDTYKKVEKDLIKRAVFYIFFMN